MAGKQADIKVGVITNYDSKGIDQAKTGFAGFKTAVSEADGFTGKFKAGFSSMGDTIAQKLSGPAGIAAIGGIFAAAGDFAFQAVSKFSALGVEVGKLRDSTGLAADEASRWIEVAGDIGIDTGELEGTIGKLNKTLGNTPGLFTDAGIEIATTKSGAVDVNQTFLNTIDRLKGMKDPADKARLATKLLGKGWQSMAELIEQGSGQLTTSLSEVADAKVFDDAKVQKARDFREAMDKLKDIAEEFTITMGTQLAPALEEVAGVLGKLGGLWGSAFGGMSNFVVGIKEAALNTFSMSEATDEVKVSQKDLAAQMAETDRETRKLKPAWELARDATEEARDAQAKYKSDSDNTKRAVKQNIDEMIGKWDELKGDVEADKSWLTLQGQFDDLRQKAADAFTAAAEGSEDAEAKGRDYQIAIDDIISDTVDYAEKVKGIPPEKLIAIRALLDQGEFDRAEAALAILTRNRTINIDLTGKGAPGYNPGTGPAFAEGGVVPGPRGAPVAATVHGGETVRTPEQEKALNDGGGGGGLTTINIYPQFMPTPKQLANILAQYDRHNATNIVTPVGR